MSTGESTYERVNDYAAVKISLARPQDIRSWSFGEVKKPETINYRSYKPEKEGLFCERIFGPEKDWECSCGHYRGMKYKGMMCDRCGVKITHSRVRRKRMGHIELAAPVVHIWFFKAMPSRLGNLLEMKTTSLEKVIYFQDYLVVDPGETPLKQKDLLTEEEYRQARHDYGPGSFEAAMGAEAIRKLLQKLDLVELSQQLRQELAKTESKQRKKELVNRLKLVEAIRDSENKPEWMVLDVIPVIPPDLRPLVLLESGRFATSDLNDLYRRIINRNNRLKKLKDLNAPEVIIRNEKRMLQQAVDALFDNGRCKRPVQGSSNRPLKSLTDMIKGKQGRFRENLLGKRVDYSARSVIVVGPSLLLHQCGLPKRIALELYQPFIIRRLKELRHADTIKSAKKMLERRDEEVWNILEEVIRNHPVLLNRAPTLHRMGIQAFEPVLVEGNAIQLHPLVCKGFNADFDGDQMAVHLPLSIEAQVEAYTLMISTHNIFSPANGAPIISASQDMVMGCYYMTLELPDRKGEGMAFANFDEVELAHSLGKVDTHARIKVKLPPQRQCKNEYGETGRAGMVIETTVGRVLFNRVLDERMPFYNVVMKSGALSRVISDCYEMLGRKATIELLDRMNRLGFHWATLSGLSFATDDLLVPPSKPKVIAATEKQVAKIQKAFERGDLTDSERYNQVVDAWTHARDQITRDMREVLRNDFRYPGYVNPIFLMSESGARGNIDQVRQLAGMRGLMAKPSGKIIETPIKANFREGLRVLEYFSSTHGARKGLADTALKTADSGYLTRKLADVAQNVVVTMHDCGTTRGVTKTAIFRGDKVEVTLADAIYGRVSRINVVDPVHDVVIVRENEMITREVANEIQKLGLQKFLVRSPMTCEAPLGVCALCYGMDLSTGALVEEGMAVGIIAAQSIGEPGTQLTMRTFHIGGMAVRGVESSQVVARRDGVIKFNRLNAVKNEEGRTVVLSRNGEIVVTDDRGRELDRYEVPTGAVLFVQEGQNVKRGTKLCAWDPHSVPILAEVDGRVRFEDLIENETMRVEKDKRTGRLRRIVREHKGSRQPQIVLEDPNTGRMLEYCYLPEKAVIEVEEGELVKAGRLLAKTPREARGTQDITGGLPRVTEIFEARKPKNPAVIAEVDGVVSLESKKQRGRRIVVVTTDNGEKYEHLVPVSKPLRVRAGDRVRAGEPLCAGPLVPHDILRISGPERVQEYLVNEIQSVYRAQNVNINDKHVEIIVAQMIRKVRVDDAGDTKLLPGTLIDKFRFKQANEELAKCVKIKDKGDSHFEVGSIVPRSEFERVNAQVEAMGGKPATGEKPKPATCSAQLLGITKAAVQSDSFISAASFQETTKVLTEAALASKVDYLVGLKENVILGHLIPAGTGFRWYQQAEVRIRPEALDALTAEVPEQFMPQFPLLEDQPGAASSGPATPAGGNPVDQMFGQPSDGGN